jgi:hypothetical protein
MSDSAAGESIAAPTPWPVQETMSAVGVGASPLASEAAVNSARLVRKTARRPRRSALRSPSSISPVIST